MTTWTLDRLSVEHVPVDVADNGTPVTGWTYLVLPRDEHPTAAADIDGDPAELDDQLGFLVGPGTDNALTPGTYRVFIRYADNPEAPVLVAGQIVIT